MVGLKDNNHWHALVVGTNVLPMIDCSTNIDQWKNCEHTEYNLNIVSSL